METYRKQMETKFGKKISDFYICENCDFKCSYKSEFRRHTITRKHQKMGFGNTLETNSSQFEQDINEKDTKHDCVCKKSFVTRSGLWKHKKICKYKEESVKNTDISLIDKRDNDMLCKLLQQNVTLISQNQELHKHLVDMHKDVKTVNQVNHINNSFNINLFLNETCKDALNISDFVDSIQLKITDLEEAAKLGYADNISNIFIRGLKDLDVSKRPIHCSDLKREVLYVKDNNSWEKETEDKSKIKKAIKCLANKNIKQIPEWIKEHPKYTDYYHEDNTEYLEIINSTMCGTNNLENEANAHKIIKNIAKVVVIDK